MVQAIVPIMGFAFGGAIAQSIGWQGCIVIMAISAGMTLATTFFMRETRLSGKSNPDWSHCSCLYRPDGQSHLHGQWPDLGNGGCNVFRAEWDHALPVRTLWHWSAGIWVFFCLCSVGYMAGNIVNRRFVSTLGLELASFWGALISASGVGFALLAHLADIGSATLVTACMVVMGFGHGFTVANSAVAAVRAAGADSGSAMGLVGASQMLISGLLGGGIVAMGGDANFTIGMGSVVCIGLFGVSMSSCVATAARKLGLWVVQAYARSLAILPCVTQVTVIGTVEKLVHLMVALQGMFC